MIDMLMTGVYVNKLCIYDRMYLLSSAGRRFSEYICVLCILLCKIIVGARHASVDFQDHWFRDQSTADSERCVPGMHACTYPKDHVYIKLRCAVSLPAPLGVKRAEILWPAGAAELRPARAEISRMQAVLFMVIRLPRRQL